MKDEPEVPDNGQCYASEDECLMHVWSGYDVGYLSYLRQKHACMQEGNCWIGRSYVQYVSHCIDDGGSDGRFEIKKEGDDYIQLTTSYFYTTPYIDPGEYHVYTHTGGRGAVFTIKTDSSEESYELSPSPMHVGSHGEALDSDYTYGNFEFKPGYRYTLIPECTPNDNPIYTARVDCLNTHYGYAECTFTDDGYYFDNVFVKLQGNITNNNPDEKYRNINKGKTEKFYMGVSGGICWFGAIGGTDDSEIDAFWRSTMISSSLTYCEYKYKKIEYGRITRVY